MAAAKKPLEAVLLEFAASFGGVLLAGELAAGRGGDLVTAAAASSSWCCLSLPTPSWWMEMELEELDCKLEAAAEELMDVPPPASKGSKACGSWGSSSGP